MKTIFKLIKVWMLEQVKDLLFQLKQSKSQVMLVKHKNLLQWKKHWRRLLKKLTNKELHLKLQSMVANRVWSNQILKQNPQQKANLFNYSNNNKLNNKKLYLINLLMKRNLDNQKLSKMKSLRRRSPWLKTKEKTKKRSQYKELKNLKISKKKRLHKNLKLKRWNKSSYLPRLSKKLRLLLPRRPPPKPILLD